jgi:hypothetical protein
MRPGIRKLLGTSLVASGLWLVAPGVDRTHGDEPPRGLGRLFRMGGSAPASAAAPVTTPSAPSLLPPPPSYNPTGTPSSDGSPRITPQPRVSRPLTESDPILTRTALARASDGTQFCDFLQVYADGTVMDGSGVHVVGREAIKPLLDVIQSGDVFRIRGHCGGPPADFIEQVHVVVYERSLGRLRANSFSYSGNPQGCDHAIKHIQTAIEAIQAKVSGPPTIAPVTSNLPTTATPTPVPTTNARPIPLTPLN